MVVMTSVVPENCQKQEQEEKVMASLKMMHFDKGIISNDGEWHRTKTGQIA